MEKYYYNGPLYYNGSKIASSTDVYTMAPSWKKACNNILAKLRRGDYNAAYDIDKSKVILVDDNKKDLPQVDTYERSKCDKCGHQLDDTGECPVCDMQNHYVYDPWDELKEIV